MSLNNVDQGDESSRSISNIEKTRFDMILAPRVKMDQVSGKLTGTNEPLLASYEEQERPAHLLIEALNN